MVIVIEIQGILLFNLGGSVASGQCFGLPMFESRSGHFLDLVLGRSEFKSSAALANSELVPSCQLGFLILLCCI